MEKSMPGDDHRRRVNRTLAVGVDGRRGSNFMAMAFVCWEIMETRRKLKRIVKPGAKPRFHKTVVSDITQFHCVERKFFKLLGFGIAVSRN